MASSESTDSNVKGGETSTFGELVLSSEPSDYVSDRNFVDFPIGAELLRALLDQGYRTATPVQAATIEPGLAGKDLLVRAKTGTGKTVAFAVPIIERIPDGERQVRGIILAPTRELAQQIADEIKTLTKYRDISCVLLVGGMPMSAQERALEDGPAIIVGTPGRVLDHLRRRSLRLSEAWSVCLDEADEMLSMGFVEDVTAILDQTPKNAQILLFSATIGAQTERLVAKYLKEPESILLSTDADRVEGIEHLLYETPPGQHRVRSLLYLLDLEDPTSAIIFCNTREDASTVANFLDRQGLDVQLMSGELPQTRRNKVMAQVKRGEVRFLVATDVAARGIDISDLSHVIQYSLPQDPAIYLHRTGRTGRIGKSGKALALIGGTDLQTRKVLEAQHGIRFQERRFPTPEECTERRVERQATQIRDAMGSMIFEAYLPTARALIARPDAEGLIAAALRAFFQWDRTRKAQMVAVDEAVEVEDTTVERRRRPDERLLRERKGRFERKPKDQPRENLLDDLDALLITEPDGTNARTEEEDLAERKKRKRRRKKKGDELSSAQGSDSSDDFASLLLVEDDFESALSVSDDFDLILSIDDDLDSILAVAEDLDSVLSLEDDFDAMLTVEAPTLLKQVGKRQPNPRKPRETSKATSRKLNVESSSELDDLDAILAIEDSLELDDFDLILGIDEPASEKMPEEAYDLDLLLSVEVEEVVAVVDAPPTKAAPSGVRLIPVFVPEDLSAEVLLEPSAKKPRAKRTTKATPKVEVEADVVVELETTSTEPVKKARKAPAKAVATERAPRAKKAAAKSAPEPIELVSDAKPAEAPKRGRRKAKADDTEKT